MSDQPDVAALVTQIEDWLLLDFDRDAILNAEDLLRSCLAALKGQMDALQALREVRALVASDSYAIQFQTMGQYRVALLDALIRPFTALPAPPASTPEER